MTPKMTKLRLVAVLIAVATGVLCSPVPLTQAASTRAEYVAQVDPMCRENLGQWQATYAAERKTFKRWVRLTNKGTLKAWVKQTHKHAAAVKRHVQVHASLTVQISAVVPPASDAQLVADWLTYRREYERLAQSAANAFDAFKFKQWDKQIGRADKAGDTEWDVAFSLGLLGACK
jgi:hypothetical protein